MKEINPKRVRKVKEKAKTENRLHCWVCGFDLRKFYGEIGDGFIDCHHNVPISEYRDEKNSRVEDMTLVCSNCHRMLHRRRPWMFVEDLREEIIHTPLNCLD